MNFGKYFYQYIYVNFKNKWDMQPATNYKWKLSSLNSNLVSTATNDYAKETTT